MSRMYEKRPKYDKRPNKIIYGNLEPIAVRADPPRRHHRQPSSSRRSSAATARSQVKLRPGRPLGGEDDDPLLMLWTMWANAPTQAEVPTDDDETRGVGYAERGASKARDRREP